MSEKYVIIGGDSGVYSGWLVGELGADGRCVLRDARHLRRYYVAGRVGDGSMFDVARLGIDAKSPSVTEPTPGESVLLGVRRMAQASEACMASLGVK